jgi:biopolymer transport protein ExbB
MLTWFAKGGPVMFFLLILSIWGTYIIVYKYLFLRANPMPTAGVLNRLKEQLSRIGKDSVVSELNRERSFVWRVIAKAISISDQSNEEIQAQVEQISRKEMSTIERNMSILSGIITVAPILGLLGTVFGLMDIFNVLSGGIIEDASLLSGGIAQALITTVFGMGISIPFILFYQYLNHRLNQLDLEVNTVLGDVLRFARLNKNN